MLLIALKLIASSCLNFEFSEVNATKDEFIPVLEQTWEEAVQEVTPNEAETFITRWHELKESRRGGGC